MCKVPDKMSDIVDLDNNKITLEEIEYISRNKIAKKEYQLKYNINLYSNILLRLTHKYFNETDAEIFWEKILAHRSYLYHRLNRDPGLMVSCLDYLTNIERILVEATIIEEGKSEFIITTNLIDELTKLFVRSVFDVILLKEYDYAKRSQSPLSLLMLDLDDFKVVNDEFGHQKGDVILEKIGLIILGSIRSMDIACRYGGEEFVVIMPNTEKKYALQIAERIRSHIDHMDFIDVHVTASIGISTLSFNSKSVAEFLKSVDIALYKAKNAGKNQVQCHNEI